MNHRRMLALFPVVLCAALTATAQVGTELIANGDFSKLDEKGWAAGWPAGRSAAARCGRRDAAGLRRVVRARNAAGRGTGRRRAAGARAGGGAGDGRRLHGPRRRGIEGVVPGVRRDRGDQRLLLADRAPAPGTERALQRRLGVARPHAVRCPGDDAGRQGRIEPGAARDPAQLTVSRAAVARGEEAVRLWFVQCPRYRSKQPEPAQTTHGRTRALHETRFQTSPLRCIGRTSS